MNFEDLAMVVQVVTKLILTWIVPPIILSVAILVTIERIDRKRKRDKLKKSIVKNMLKEERRWNSEY